MYKIIGVRRNQGEYNGVNYDHYKLYMVKDNPNVIGKEVLIEKIKVEDMSNLLNQLAQKLKKDVCPVNDLINVEFQELLYNRYGRVQTFIF